jgi:propionyl-CoA synthetase
VGLVGVKLATNKRRDASAGQMGETIVGKTYAETHGRSLADPKAFWAEAAQAVEWSRPWDSVLSTGPDGLWRWFAGAETNTCWNALDRHVRDGRGDQVALIYDSPLTGSVRRLTYAALLGEVSRCAGMLSDLGIAKGDRVLLYMPVIPEAIVAMLACARIGAVHSVVFGGFAAREIATRIVDARPKLIIAASCGVEPNRVIPYMPVVDAAVAMAGGLPQTCVVVQRDALRAELKPGRDLDWNDLMAMAEPVGCVPVGATDPLYILYTSGTTGQPKGIVRPSGGHLVAMAWSMRHVFDAHPGEAFWAASDIGWVVGHSYIVYGPLITGCTTVLYEGKPVGTPDAGAFWRVIEDHKVSTMFTAPTAIRAIRREDSEAKLLAAHDISSLKSLFVAGERCDPATLVWLQDKLRRPIVDNWWQTETGWPIAANPLGIEAFPVKPGSATKPIPGWHVEALGPDGNPVAPGDTGAIVCKLPLPPGAAHTLWNAPERYASAYLERYPGYYTTGDAGFIDADGYLHIMTRTDDVINVAGHRLSTGAIEEVIAGHPDIAECAVVGMPDSLRGQAPLGLLVLKAGIDRQPAEIVAEVVQRVRDLMGAIVAFKTAIVVARLPKTRSGKILRGTIVKMLNGDDYALPATIEDPAVLGEIERDLGAAGLVGAGVS